MASNEQRDLVQAQQEAVKAMAALTENLRSSPTVTGSATPAGTTGGLGNLEVVSSASTADATTAGSPSGSTLQHALEVATNAVTDLSQTTTTNTQALTNVSSGLAGLPELLSGLAGGLQGGGGVLGSIFGSGFGLASIGLGIAGLFGGGSSSPQPLTRTIQPPSLALEVANTDDILAGFPRAAQGQGGEVRTAESQAPVVAQPQVTVNVSAMDSRSFLDHSGDIAQAVREAMLNMHPVNDLITEL
ncbi:MAG TPA: hypothetical protein VEU62_04140 [Bryobacterales bacterium]|nr:hypothetical protein [Bryobacterales bacterium]